MKISRKLKNRIQETINRRIDALRSDIEQGFRDGKLDYDNWATIDRSILSMNTQLTFELEHEIELYRNTR